MNYTSNLWHQEVSKRSMIREFRSALQLAKELRFSLSFQPAATCMQKQNADFVWTSLAVDEDIGKAVSNISNADFFLSCKRIS
ncbi:hypothetical protein LOK49_LG02G02905 [Camellia lanceoleosa]|uniref:Uncharacterized protein n=1 Tax=Camellia lanceoleosa TaxID=1840588 RepID=A0ACC0IQG7_9ERIC|nr:hypothetical protein LOK49_LG02G02905 [Camellia lanceoleosa]